MLTTQFFAHEDPALHARARHHASDARQGRGQGVPQRRAATPTPGGARRCREEEIARRADGRRPADAVHVLLARRGRAWRWCWPRPTGPPRTPTRRCSCARPCCARGRSARSRCSARALAAERGNVPVGRRRRRPRSSMAGIGPTDDRRRPGPGHRVAAPRSCTWPRCGFCADGEQEDLIQRRRHRDRRPTAGQHRRRLPRQRRADRRVRAAPGARDRAAAPRAGRRAPGAGRPQGGLHPRLRRPRHQRLHGAFPLSEAGSGRPLHLPLPNC